MPVARSATEKVTVLVAWTTPRGRASMRALREWLHGNPTRALESVDVEVVGVRSVREAVERANRAVESTVIVVTRAAAVGVGSVPISSDAEMVFVEPAGAVRFAPPDASPIPGRSQVSAGGHPGPAVRKALLRLRMRSQVRIRPLREDDLPGYFSLRHRVWREVGYLGRARSDQTEWEVDFYDRASLPLGAYPVAGTDDEPVGCVRLLFEAGKDRGIGRAVRRVVARARDPHLNEAIELPAHMFPPFDMLHEIPDFRDVYRERVVKEQSKAELSRVVVAREWRGFGVGEALVDSAVRLAELSRIRLLFLACKEEHEAFYRHSGFRRVPGARCDRFANLDVPAIAMIRETAAPS